MKQTRWEISLDKQDFSDITLHDNLASTSLREGQIELQLNTCALTANNITYALLGNSFGPWQRDAGYWDFFSQDKKRGRLPVWGLAEVSASRSPQVQSGQQVYGYFPLSSHSVMTPAKTKGSGFIDATPARATLPAVYNRYSFTDQLQGFRKEDEDMWPVFQPLLITSFMITDQLEDENYYGADTIVVASASSKTACTFARCMSALKTPPRIIGLTSAANQAFVTSTDLYQQVQSYDTIESLPSSTPTVFIDMAGNHEITSRVHHHFGDSLKYSLIVGKAHWDSALPNQNMPGPALDAFFAPARVKRRVNEWGPSVFAEKLDHMWQHFLVFGRQHFDLQYRHGASEAVSALKAAISGDISPRQATLLTFHE